MAKFKLEIETKNAAFGDNPELELSRLLAELAEDVEQRQLETYTLVDYNGNTVGKATWK
jgi:hypothetical protein